MEELTFPLSFPLDNLSTRIAYPYNLYLTSKSTSCASCGASPMGVPPLMSDEWFLRPFDSSRTLSKDRSETEMFGYGSENTVSDVRYGIARG